MTKLKAVKREGYFTRVRKRWKRRDVVEIDENHPKFHFSQYIRAGTKLLLQNPHRFKPLLDEEDYKSTITDNFQSQFNNTLIHMTEYAPPVFHYLRKRCGISSSEYLDILSPQNNDDFYLEFLSNSKSGQNFFLTNNKQFMIKTITQDESEFFLQILQLYLDHFEKYPHSLMVKFLGLYSMKVKKLRKPVYFIVMLSIFYPGERILERYDIKACEIGRYTTPGEPGSNAVVILKEKNFNEKKINLGQQRDWILLQIKHDTEFLQRIKVLDYSLLVGLQPLHEDEKKNGFASVVQRANKSISQSHCVYHQPTNHTHHHETPFQEPDNLPGMVDDNHICGCLRQNSPEPAINGSLTQSRSHAMSCSNLVSGEEMTKQNRRLLPDYKNELHVIDGELRYYVGIIDFFTRYTLKKRLENAYKRIIYPPMSFSTVHPDLFAARFRDYWEKHTE